MSKVFHVNVSKVRRAAQELDRVADLTALTKHVTVPRVFWLSDSSQAAKAAHAFCLDWAEATNILRKDADVTARAIWNAATQFELTEASNRRDLSDTGNS